MFKLADDDLSVICRRCGRTKGRHSAIVLRCPNGGQFEPSPGRRDEGRSEEELVRDAERMGVKPLYSPVWGHADEDGKRRIERFELANRPDVEDAALLWRRRQREAKVDG